VSLATATVTYLELIGNGRTYRVPPYQRDYAWTEEQWEDLWNDIQDLRRNPKDQHYLGALVVQASSDREFLVIDGQQRLATLSIFALAVIAELQEMARGRVDADRNLDRAAQSRARFVGEKDPASLIERSRLSLNEADDGFYQDQLVQIRAPLNPRGLTASRARLWECLGYFRKQLRALADVRGDGAALTSVLSETVARQLLFILITVDDELNAYTVFETLNARGLELTTTDLLKNYLFSKTPAADLDVLKRRWQRLLETVTEKEFPAFLRFHLLCEHRQVRKERLLRLVRSAVRTGEDVFRLLDALEARAELFAALGNAHHEYWIERQGAKHSIWELTLFRARQFIPVLFAAWERFTEEDFDKLLSLVTVITFRYSVVGKLAANALEAAYAEAARAILEGHARRPRAVFNQLRSVYVDDARFEDDFTRLAVPSRGLSKRLAKYILCRLEGSLTADRDPDTDPGTVEHVLPQNPSEEWFPSFSPALVEASVNRIGNLTLLEPALNREAGNRSFTAKCAAYQASNYGLSREIPALAPEEWTFDLLEHRQRLLAERAVRIWSTAYAQPVPEAA
jgi:hypothetical protein